MINLLDCDVFYAGCNKHTALFPYFSSFAVPGPTATINQKAKCVISAKFSIYNRHPGMVSRIPDTVNHVFAWTNQKAAIIVSNT